MVTTAVARCRCGAVVMNLKEPLAFAVNCHCELCRSINGAPFMTYVPVKTSAVQVAQGRENISMYRVTPGTEKHWCRDCDTPLFNTNVQFPGMTMLYFGTIMAANRPTPGANVWCSGKLPWIDGVAAMKNFAEAVPRRG